MRGFALHHPDAVELGPSGVADDRRYSLLTADGRIFEGTKLGPLVQIRADLERDNGTERLAVRLPSGEVVSQEVALGASIQLDIYDRVFTACPVIGPWADAISAWAGRRLQLFRSEGLPEVVRPGRVTVGDPVSVM